MRNCSVWALISVIALSMPVSGAAEGTLGGVVIASELPLQDCGMSLYLLDSSRSKYLSTTVTRTGKDGSYRFQKLAVGDYILLVQCGSERVYQGKVAIRNGANQRDVRLDANAVPIQVQLNRIVVEADGSTGKTGWLFDVFADGRKVLSLPNTDYDDTKGKNLYAFPPLAKVSTAILVPSSGTVKIEVVGTRSFGGDKARGSAQLQPRGSAVDILVRKDPTKRSGGSFTFSLSPL
jgi:hypothetical protein